MSDHSGLRKVSDKLDATIWKGGYKNKSYSRHIVHGGVHAAFAACNYKNNRGADWQRVKDHGNGIKQRFEWECNEAERLGLDGNCHIL